MSRALRSPRQQPFEPERSATCRVLDWVREVLSNSELVVSPHDGPDERENVGGVKTFGVAMDESRNIVVSEP